MKAGTTKKNASRLSSSSSSPELHLTKVILKRNQQSKAFRNGNQLVFTRAIQRFEGGEKEPKLAELVQVMVDDDPKPVALGYGVYNPHSLYRVRILCHRFLQSALFHAISLSPDTATALQCILRHHFRKAVLTRQTALQLPSPDGFTDTYRLVNGEGDQLSGIAVDMIGGSVAVVMISAAWGMIHRSAITSCLQEFLPDGTTIMWKTTPSRLKQDGFDLDHSNSDESKQWEEEDSVKNHQDRCVISTENGVRYHTYPYGDGQKTGVYCDQRENRWNVAQLCRDKRVLDLCCYHGGFSLNAVLNGGALCATGVDSSEDAIHTCQQNAKLNGCSEHQINFIRSDISTFLQEAAATTTTDPYDVIVLDPPKLAPSAAGLDKARRKYHAFNRDASRLINPADGGLLLTCTCSAAMTQKDGGRYFLQMVQGAALAANREVTLLRVSGAAPCHTQSPIASPAGAYLTAALFYVHPIS